MPHRKKQHDEEHDDITVEADVAEGSSLRPKGESDLRSELSAAKKEAQEYLAGWQRAKADFANLKKETAEERRHGARFAVEDFIAQCIPVLDSFDMAFRDKNTWNEAPENWRRGVEYIYTQFLSVLRANGVEKVTPLNERFDPLVHDSVGTAPIDTLEREGIILDVIQNGYTLSGKLIRAPKVIVGHYVLPHH